jgi:hypothetical protein
MVERKEAPPRATGLSALPTRDDEGRWLAVIEATQGTRHKFKYHAPSDAFVLSGVLPLGLGFPYDFGFPAVDARRRRRSARRARARR